MSSEFANEGTHSGETSTKEKECPILRSSHYRQKYKKTKNNFQSPVLAKRLKTKHEIIDSPKEDEKLTQSSDEEKQMIAVRRSKRNKNCNLNKQLQNVLQKDIKCSSKNDIQKNEGKNFHEDSFLNLIPDNVIKSLDNELFAEEAIEKENLDIKCIGDISKENQPVISTKEINLSIKDNIDDNTLQQVMNLNNDKFTTKTVECDTRYLKNYSEISCKIIANNKNKAKSDNREEKLEKIGSADRINEIPLETLEDNEKYEKFINLNCVKNDIVPNDSNLGMLYVGIEKAGDIISSLSNKTDVEKDYTVNKSTIQAFNIKQTSISSNVAFIDKSIYTKHENNTSDINLANNCNRVNENSSCEIHLPISGKYSQILIEDKQKDTSENKKIKNIQKEKIDETQNYFYNTEETDKNIEMKDCLSADKILNNLDMGSAKEVDQNEIIKSDSYEKLENQTSFTNEINFFPIENDLDNSKKKAKLIQNALITEIDIENKIINSKEDVEIKQKKLTLLYMSALDYERDNKENAFEAMRKHNTINEFFCPNLDGELKNTDNFAPQNNLELFKQDLNDPIEKTDENNTQITILPNVYQNIESKIDEKDQLNEIMHENNTMTNLLPQINQNLNENRILNVEDELNENSKENSKESKKNNEDLEIGDTSYITNKTIINKQCQSKEDQNFLPKVLNNISEYNDEANDEAEDVKQEETEKCLKDKCTQDVDMISLVTAADCLKSEENQNSEEIINDRNGENITEDKQNEDIIKYEDVEGSFDLDDDFHLTASQINIIDINENSQCNEPSKSISLEKMENNSNTHFSTDSITVEIIDQLTYIRKSVDSIKEILIKLSEKNEETK